MTNPHETPRKEHNVLQVPSSSPINVRSSPAASSVIPPSINDHRSPEEKHKDEMRRRFYSHKNWPIVSKRFYYLNEAELFKAMVKGKGNLRDISQWLAENHNLGSRMKQHDDTQKAIIAAETERRKKELAQSNAEAFLRREKELQKLEEARVKADAAAAITPAMDEIEVASPVRDNYDDEDGSPIKVAGKARQKRALSAVENVKAPDTKVQLLKPKVSILEKYRNRQQMRIDSMFQNAPSLDDRKKRRLVRANDMYVATPEQSVAASPILSLDNPGALTSVFGYNDSEVPKLKTGGRSELNGIDELEMLEEKIRENKRKKKGSKTVESDDELEEEVFSDDMSAEDDDDMYSNGLTSIDGQILEFLNQASGEDIVEICNVKPAIADIIISKRPFNSIYAVAEDRFDEATPEPETKKRNQRKTLGMKIVESTEFSLKGYKAVDSLVKKCSEYGNLISKQMDLWGVKVTGEGELDIVDLDVENSEVKDEDDEDDIVAPKKRGLSYIKHKPTLLAPEIDLKNYQQVGINWLNLLYHNKLSCILADEMGLGKTCQVISFMAYLKASSEKKRPHLVVVPSSTLENWLREFNKFCPDIVVQAYYGSQSEREDLRYELQETEYDVLVTTYNLATGAPSDFKFLKNQQFDIIVYDEGHMLKNSNSERYNKLMRLKADYRLLLTGTPLQNNLKELVSLLAFMLPQLFVEKREDLQGLFNKKASVDSTKDYNPLLSQQAINKAKTMMTPFVLRRKKAQVLKYLPKKHHEIIKCSMTQTQKAIYDEHIEKGKSTKIERERRKQLTGKEAEIAKKTPVASSSNVMMSLRKASMHPLLFRRNYTDDMLGEMSRKIMKEPEYVNANRAYIEEDMSVMSDYELNALCEKFPNTMGSYILDKEKWHDSGKVLKLMEVIQSTIERNEKILVFSLFTQMLDILEKVLSFANISFLRLDGQTSVDTRQDIIDRFYEDDTIPVFLLSTKAGGFGINLIAANNVVIFDQSFNPHDDKQAEDRAHRVGQTNEVLVTKLISENTIDENILMLAENKLQLDHSISNEANESKFEEKASSMFEKLLFGA